MNMKSEHLNGYNIVSLRGAMDVESVALLKEDFAQLTEQVAQGVVVDMNAVNFLDSSGIGALVFMYKRLHARDCTLHLVGLTGQPQKLVRLLRIDKTIKTHLQMADISGLLNSSPAMES